MYRGKSCSQHFFVLKGIWDDGMASWICKKYFVALVLITSINRSLLETNMTICVSFELGISMFLKRKENVYSF